MSRLGWALIVVLSGIAVASPYAGLIPGWTPALATTIALKALALIGLNLIFGICGMLAFGQAAFMALPGYIAGMLAQAGMPLVLALVSGILGAVMLARIMAEAFVRLPGVYLAVGTLGFGYVVEGMVRAFPSVTGGASGLVFASGRELGVHTWYAIAVTALICGVATFAWQVRGATWRRLRTLRHDELAASVLGIDVVREKARVYTLGAAYAACGGLLLAYYVGVLIPEDAGVTRSLEQVGTVLLGGAGFVVGPLIGAALVEWLFVVAGYGARFELLIYGAVFLAVVIYAPRGIAGWLVGPWQRIVGASQSSAAARPLALPPSWKESTKRDGVCLSVDSVSKRFGGVVAVECASFQVHYGEIFTLVGPNGAGKTTLFNVISGIIAPSGGAVLLEERDLADVPIHRRAPFIGRSFQVARLVPELTAKENVMVRLDQIAPRLTEAEREAVALAQLGEFGLLELAERPVSALSLGQHKLIDLVRAACGDPPLVLLDEPAVGLGGDELAHLARMLATMKARGSAIVIVEHNIDFVAKVAERGVVLDSGRQIAHGPIGQILADPQVRAAYFGVLA